MENGDIQDNQITASSEWDANHRAANGRLNFIPLREQRGGWTSLHRDLYQWLQVDFQRTTFVTGISTQGRRYPGKTQLVKSYTISSSQDGKNFQTYKQGEKVKEFQGNNDQNTIVHHTVIPHISARFIRLHPTAWQNFISMRVEFYGCS
ncbi:neuropilin-1-like [Dendronephthya gigantea]|uniref:neuropilin-1-like n=1 Tax=Dendronephthya gigantea TaxID=151771 RepID=UPI00106C5CC6|nr:neuropilin-1-like [Dendronephthya gigantea]